MMNGHLPSPWSKSNYVVITIQDWFDNKISLPAVSSLSLVFSLANMIKAGICLNVYKTYGSKRRFSSPQTQNCSSKKIAFPVVKTYHQKCLLKRHIISNYFRW